MKLKALRAKLEDKKEMINKLSKNEQKAFIRVRLLGIKMFLGGKKLIEVAEALGVAYRTVKEWLVRFAGNGIEGMSDAPGRGRKPRFKNDKADELEKEIAKMREEKNGGRITAKDIQKRIQEKWHVFYQTSGVYRLLNQHKIVWITGRSKHPKSDPQAQEEFKKKSNDKIREVLPPHVSLEQVDVWFLDETRVGQQGSLTRTWAKKGTRPRLTKQQEFLATYIFAAVCPNLTQEPLLLFLALTLIA